MEVTIQNYEITAKYDDIAIVEYYVDTHLCTIQMEVEKLSLSDSEREQFIKAGKTGEGMKDYFEFITPYLLNLHNLPCPVSSRIERVTTDQEQILKSIKKIANGVEDPFLRGQLIGLVDKYNSNTVKVAS